MDTIVKIFSRHISNLQNVEKKSSLGQFKNLQHYDYISNFRPNVTAERVAVYIKKTINHMLKNDSTHMNEGISKSIFIDIQFGNDKITCGTIYRAPKQDRFSNNQFKVQFKYYKRIQKQSVYHGKSKLRFITRFPYLHR